MPQKFRTAQEEIAYLKERIAEKEKELDAPASVFETERVAKREIVQYAETPAPAVLHETVVLAEHDATRTALQLEPEEHDTQIDALLKIVAEKGIRNALSVAAKMDNAHIEDDLHRALIRYIAEGLPVGGDFVARALESSATWRALHMTLYEVQPQGAFKREEEQKGLEHMLASMEQLYSGLLALSSGNKESKQNVFSLEIAVPQGTEDAMFYIAVPSKKKDLFERHVLSIFPNAKLIEQRGDYNIFNHEGYHTAAYATLAEHPSLPIRTYEEFKHDPMNVLLSAFGKLKKYGEGAAIQIVVGNEGDRYTKYYRKILRQLNKGKKFKKAIKVPESKMGEVLDDFAKGLFAGDKKKEEEHHVEQEYTERVQKKMKTNIVPVNIRLLASAGHEDRARDIVANLASTFNQFEDPQGNRIVFKETSWWTTKGEMHNFVMREPESSRAIPLNFSELTSIYHLTAEGVRTSRELKQSRAKQSPAPTDMPEEGIVLGFNRFGAVERKIHFAAEDRLRHCYIVGQTGTGKTTLMLNMAIQDIKNGEGVCYIDPHGSDIQTLLAAIPPEREKDVIYFDPGFFERPMGLNMLEYDLRYPEQKTFLVDELIGIFRKLYKDVPESIGPAFEQYFRNSALLVMEDPATGNTMVDITRVFANPQFRDLKLSRCSNPIVVQFWRDIATKTQGEQSLENFAQYVTNKFDIFLANEIMRPIIAQEHSAFDFRTVMDEKKILLINLAKGRMGEMNSSLLGLIFVGKLLNAALSRVDMIGSGQMMHPFYLYIDEFQNFTTPSIATILSEARKYKLVLNIAHQFIDQLTDDIRDSVFGNVGTRCVFRVGEKDAEFLEKIFHPEFTMSDIMHLDNFNAYLALLVHGKPVRPFNMETRKPDPYDFGRLDFLKRQSYEKYGRPREEVEAEIRARYSTNAQPPSNLGNEAYGSF